MHLEPEITSQAHALLSSKRWLGQCRNTGQRANSPLCHPPAVRSWASHLGLLGLLHPICFTWELHIMGPGAPSCHSTQVSGSPGHCHNGLASPAKCPWTQTTAWSHSGEEEGSSHLSFQKPEHSTSKTREEMDVHGDSTVSGSFTYMVIHLIFTKIL